jgi:hypothetical protein
MFKRQEPVHKGWYAVVWVVSLTLGLEAGVCEIGGLWFGLAHPQLGFLHPMSVNCIFNRVDRSSSKHTLKSFAFSFFFLLLDPILT